ncbi:hypothetical protein K0M31_014971 [Melipona bicolor]|uniref:Uncharacterized protein n=1 Tax=Melipona bicolor TaxID=60889 RepID=A0AA40FGM6_9HYME|nr:hypothetical protein K0M31_014971 [Melipona bicolor]
MFNWNGGDTATHIHTHIRTYYIKHRLEKIQRVVIPFGSHRQTFVAPLKKKKKKRKRKPVVDSTKATAFTLDRGFVVGDRGPKKKRKKKEKIPFYDRLYVFLRVFSAF